MSDSLSNEEVGKITEEALEEVKEKIGEPIDEPDPYVTEATKDTIRHWAHGLGIDDPLYTDEEYAQNGPYGELVAPPTFLYTTSRVAVAYAYGLPGVHSMHGGADWEWYQPIRRGDEIRTESYMKDLVEKDTSFAGRTFQQIYRIEFYNQNDEHLASLDRWSFRLDRDEGRDRKKYDNEGVELADWDEDDIERFAEHYRNEERRGDDPRYFEDVEVGDELDTLLKGPITVTSVIALNQGLGGGFTRAHKRMFQLFDEHPALAIPNDQGVPEPPERVHWDTEYAQRVGVPAPFDYGPERISWMDHVVSHWMGDEGFLKSLYAELRRHNLMGDVTWCSGEVTDKRVEDGEYLVDISVEGRNQRDEVNIAGEAVVELPSKEESG
jgi:acyl dehydratase